MWSLLCLGVPSAEECLTFHRGGQGPWNSCCLCGCSAGGRGGSCRKGQGRGNRLVDNITWTGCEGGVKGFVHRFYLQKLWKGYQELRSHCLLQVGWMMLVLLSFQRLRQETKHKETWQHPGRTVWRNSVLDALNWLQALWKRESMYSLPSVSTISAQKWVFHIIALQASGKFQTSLKMMRKAKGVWEAKLAVSVVTWHWQWSVGCFPARCCWQPTHAPRKPAGWHQADSIHFICVGYSEGWWFCPIFWGIHWSPPPTKTYNHIYKYSIFLTCCVVPMPFTFMYHSSDFWCPIFLCSEGGTWANRRGSQGGKLNVCQQQLKADVFWGIRSSL